MSPSIFLSEFSEGEIPRLMRLMSVDNLTA